MTESDPVSDTFTASVTPIPGSLGTMTIHTAWKNDGPLPEAMVGRTKSRGRTFGFDVSRYPNLGPIAASILLILGFTGIGFVDLDGRLTRQQTRPYSTIADRQKPPLPAELAQFVVMRNQKPLSPEAVQAAWKSATSDAEFTRKLQEQLAAREREAQIQAARKELPSFGGIDTPSVLNAAERERLKSLIIPILPQEPAIPTEREGHGAKNSNSLLASNERRSPP